MIAAAILILIAAPVVGTWLMWRRITAVVYRVADTNRRINADIAFLQSIPSGVEELSR